MMLKIIILRIHNININFFYNDLIFVKERFAKIKIENS